MRKRILALALCFGIVANGITVFADEKDERIAELEAQVEQLQNDLNDALALIMVLSGEDAEEATEDTIVLPEGEYTEIGEGTVYMACAGGTTEEGNIPVIYAAKDTWLMQVGLDAWGFNGEALSYIYIDGVLFETYQLADTQTSLDLGSEQLLAGVHKVEVVQYENDDVTAEIITYKTFSYEVKEE